MSAPGSPSGPARPVVVSGRVDVPHHLSQVLRMASGLLFLADPLGKAFWPRTGASLFSLHRSLRTRRALCDDAAVDGPVPEDRRPPSRFRGSSLAAHVVLSRRTTDRPQHDCAQTAGA